MARLRGIGWAWACLVLLPVLVHAPALSGRFRADPIYVLSGLTPGTWTTNGILPGMPWIDGNVGTTTQALGTLIAHDWLLGILPWWNPYSGVGLPLAAEGQTPAFFLPFVLLLALPHGLLLLHMTLMALAGCFSFALLRRLGISLVPALVAAGLFELNGTFAWLGHGPVMPVAFLPLVLLGLEAARTRFSGALAMGVAWSLVAGFPETAALDLAFAAVWGLVRLVGAVDPVAYVRRACLSAGCGMLLSLPATWPFLEALPREFLGSHEGPIATSLMPANLALQLFPGVLGAPMTGFTALGLSDAVWMHVGGYTDIVLVTLALAGLRWRARARGLRMAVVAWLLVTGARAWGVGPLVWLFGLVPLLGKANLHLYCVPSWSMGLALLAGFALQDWRDGLAVPWRRLGVAAAVLTALALTLARPEIADLWHRLPAYRPLLPLCLGVPLLVCAAALGAMRRGWSARREGWLGALVLGNAAWLCMLPLFAGTHGRRIDAGAIRYLQNQKQLGRVWSIGPLVPNYGAMFGIAAIEHNYLPVPRSWVAYERSRLMGGPDGVNFYAGWPATAPALASRMPAYAQAGVRFVAVQAGVMPFPPAAAAALRPAYRGTVMDIWAVPDAAPYWRAPGCALSEASRDAVRADCPRGGVLRRLELSWPGWCARVGGRETVITTVEDVFQSVALPAGISRVEFRYAPPGIWRAWMGWWLGLVGLSGFYLVKAVKRFA